MKGYDQCLEMISGLCNDFKDAIAHGDQKAFNRVIEQHRGISGTVLIGAEVSRREKSLRKISDVEYRQKDPLDFRGSLEHAGTLIYEKGAKAAGPLAPGASPNKSMPGATSHGTSDAFSSGGSNAHLAARRMVGAVAVFASRARRRVCRVT